ncbi:hypothetical protein B0H16DRAFT_1666280 [Mycena metata]|uniref:Fe2OG dioxygenase domain-containing protein n=1 Tax=Mycena metata TaxID=1033252 RepID=A0AAD7HJA2_9AGAR|nr:hypothetical protein B0H16DRAFT_1666280 [Mycena metata]
MSRRNPSRAKANVEKLGVAHHMQVLRDALDVISHLTFLLRHFTCFFAFRHCSPKSTCVFWDGGTCRIDLRNAKKAEFVALAAACDQATFGVAQKDVLDETYRKAGKMDLAQFASRLDVVASGLIDAIAPGILQGQGAEGDKTLRAELYKLNVYGEPWRIFQSHKDTPRGETMIGSLVVIFPTAHTGGALTLEHGGTTWTFDSVAALAVAEGPALAYVASYSDVLHAVEKVKSGYRVSLTYNLFLVDNTMAIAGNRIIPAPEKKLEDSLRALLADPLFLTKGGFLAYGLAHQYPIPPPPEVQYTQGGRQVPPSRLGPILKLLKGGDARIHTVSERVGLVTRVKVLYDTGEHIRKMGKDVLADDVLNTEAINTEYDMVCTKRSRVWGSSSNAETRACKSCRRRVHLTILPTMIQMNSRQGSATKKAVKHKVAVEWVTRITETNRVRLQYLAYGNEASIEHVYGNAALFLEVPAAGKGIRA